MAYVCIQHFKWNRNLAISIRRILKNLNRKDIFVELLFHFERMLSIYVIEFTSLRFLLTIIRLAFRIRWRKRRSWYSRP